MFSLVTSREIQIVIQGNAFIIILTNLESFKRTVLFLLDSKSLCFKIVGLL